MKAKIREYAKELGIDAIGFADGEPLFETREFLAKMKEEGFLSEFVKDDLDQICNPRMVMKGANTVIVCAISYKIDDPKVEEERMRANKELRARLSRFAWGKDYHRVLGEKLDRLIDFLEKEFEEFKGVKFVDNGPTVDRALARKAGIGWQGKNCSIINQDYGSWIFLGGIITNLDLETDEPVENRCGECRRCIEACPTGALVDDYTLDSRKCLGYITLSKGHIPRKYRKKMGNRLWGCDTCQDVCPHNKKTKAGNHKEFKPGELGAYPELAPLLAMSNKGYKKKFMPTPMNWRGKRPIQRNAAIILGNLRKEESLPHLIEALKDPKPIVRGSAVWAIGQIGSQRALDALEKALIKENDEKVREEIRQVLSTKR
ncbi:tRNA epoxyqueuosine(34) reductase QueG [Halonatronum saccharophilum]|uniref:tRNA epoxyqueuosine(34) reductase QueG n=1 Tax=Halonatronum saccharophilum TaxID=150060 RepID=UPI000487CBEE|nr:tRNA epoxyqueuosine(34) reductase QueG [Halonatronum saccharophilum]